MRRVTILLVPLLLLGGALVGCGKGETPAPGESMATAAQGGLQAGGTPKGAPKGTAATPP